MSSRALVHKDKSDSWIAHKIFISIRAGKVSVKRMSLYSRFMSTNFSPCNVFLSKGQRNWNWLISLPHPEPRRFLARGTLCAWVLRLRCRRPGARLIRMLEDRSRVVLRLITTGPSAYPSGDNI